jgi:hypothetical protein
MIRLHSHQYCGGNMPDSLFSPTTTLINALPTPRVIRERLGVILREAELLRRMLRLAERIAQERGRRHQNGGDDRA